MSWFSYLAIYFLFWVFSLFLVLPYGVRTTSEEGEELVPGQAPSAPHRFSMRHKLMWTTIVSAVLFALFILNWEMGWITREHLFAITPSLDP